MPISLSDYSWPIADLTTISRADLHIAVLMFLENVKLGYAKHVGLNKEIVPDYQELQEAAKDTNATDLEKQIGDLFNSFAKDHSDLIKNLSTGNKEEFEILLDKALNDVTGDQSADGAYAAIVAGVKYQTLAEAVANSNNKIIKLLADVIEDIIIPADIETTLNLNGYTITNKESHTITNKGNLTVVGTGTVDNVTHQKSALFNDVGGTVVLENGLFNRSKENGQSASDSGGNSYYTILNHGDMTINDDVVISQGKDSEGKFSSLIDNGWYDGNNNTTKTESTLTINGGKMIGGLIAVKNDDFGVLTVNGGEILNCAQNSILNWNVATINGGTIACDKIAVYNDYCDAESDKGILTINGGKISGTIADIKDNGASKGSSVTVVGGTYYHDVSNFVSEGYKVVPYGNKFKVVVDEDYKPETNSEPLVENNSTETTEPTNSEVNDNGSVGS